MFASPDAATLTNYAPLLGPDRASRSNSFRLFDDAGAVQAFGSEATYLRRYGWSAILGIASEPDDDGDEHSTGGGSGGKKSTSTDEGGDIL